MLLTSRILPAGRIVSARFLCRRITAIDDVVVHVEHRLGATPLQLTMLPSSRSWIRFCRRMIRLSVIEIAQTESLVSIDNLHPLHRDVKIPDLDPLTTATGI